MCRKIKRGRTTESRGTTGVKYPTVGKGERRHGAHNHQWVGVEKSRENTKGQVRNPFKGARAHP